MNMFLNHHLTAETAIDSASMTGRSVKNDNLLPHRVSSRLGKVPISIWMRHGRLQSLEYRTSKIPENIDGGIVSIKVQELIGTGFKKSTQPRPLMIFLIKGL